MAKFKLAYVIESAFKQATLFTMCLKWTVGLCPSLFAHELMTLLFSKELNQSTLWRVSMKQEKKVISRSSSKLRFQIPSYGLYFLLLYYSRLILFIHPVNFLKGSSCPLKSSSSCTRSNMPPSRKHECFFVPKHNSNFFFFFFFYFNTESNKTIRFGL